MGRYLDLVREHERATSTATNPATAEARDQSDRSHVVLEAWTDGDKVFQRYADGTVVEHNPLALKERRDARWRCGACGRVAVILLDTNGAKLCSRCWRGEHGGRR